MNEGCCLVMGLALLGACLAAHAQSWPELPEGPDALVREGPSDFELRDDKVRYETPNGCFVISYEQGFPVGRFEGTVPGRADGAAGPR